METVAAAGSTVIDVEANQSSVVSNPITVPKLTGEGEKIVSPQSSASIVAEPKQVDSWDAPIDSELYVPKLDPRCAISESSSIQGSTSSDEGDPV